MRKKELKEVAIFFIITIFLSYFIFWGPIALFKVPTINLVDGVGGPIWAIILFIIGGFIPSITGIVLSAIFEGKKGVWQLIKRAFQFKIGVKWFSIIILVMFYFAFTLISIYTIIGGKFDYSQFWIQLQTIIPLIILGPLSEEYGWRGFALKRLLKHIDANLSSLIIGFVWALWHLPLFFMLGTAQYQFHLPFPTFAISVISISFVYTYIYKQTKQNLFSAVFLHWVYTYTIQVVSSSIIRSNVFNWLEFVPALLVGLVFAFLLRKERLPLESSVSSPNN